MVKTRRTVQDNSAGEEDLQAPHLYPTRSKELNGLRITGKLIPSHKELREDADCPLLRQLEMIREEAKKQLDRLQDLVTVLNQPLILIPNGTLTERDQLFLCQICSHSFDHKVRRPLCLPCGHTICHECTKMISSSNLRGFCPFDRKDLPSDLTQLPVNQAVLEQFSLHSKPPSLLCTAHNSPFVAYNPLSRQLLCGACILIQNDNVCFPLNSDQAQAYQKTQYEGLVRLATQVQNYLALWKHFSELLDVYSADPMDVYGSIYEQKQFAEVLGDIDDAVYDLSELTEEIIGLAEERLAQMVVVQSEWDTLTPQEQFSLQLEDVYRSETLTPVFRLAVQLLDIPLSYQSS